jgi:hypothetical protein
MFPAKFEPASPTSEALESAVTAATPKQIKQEVLAQNDVYT